MSTDKMIIGKIKDISSNWLTESEQKSFEFFHKIQIHRLPTSYLSRFNNVDVLINYIFRDFWLLCGNPIPILYRDFKYRNRYIITHDKDKECDKMVEMKFGAIETIPKMGRGRKAKDYLAILQKIPIGKYWNPQKEDCINQSTLRKAIEEMEKAKTVTVEEYTVVQRTVNKVSTLYVLHNVVDGQVIKPKK